MARPMWRAAARGWGGRWGARALMPSFAGGGGGGGRFSCVVGGAGRRKGRRGGRGGGGGGGAAPAGGRAADHSGSSRSASSVLAEVPGRMLASRRNRLIVVSPVQCGVPGTVPVAFRRCRRTPS